MLCGTMGNYRGNRTGANHAQGLPSVFNPGAASNPAYYTLGGGTPGVVSFENFYSKCVVQRTLLCAGVISGHHSITLSSLSSALGGNLVGSVGHNGKD